MLPLPTFQNPRRPGTALPEPQVGETIGRFQLRRRVGQGGQATVWLAFDPRLEREVAIKLLHPEPGTDAAQVAHWLREARSVSRLTHPNVIPVFEADVHEGQPYLVFEFVPGQTLAEILRLRGALAPQEAVGLMIDVLEALAAAHAAGIVHRDLKPSNVLVDAGGRARVMDFGIAERVQDSEGVSAAAAGAGPSGGTPGYMSPEAATGAPPTAAMDIFSAAIVLTELLCGHRLIDERDPWRAMQRVALEDLTLPAGLGSEVDDALRAILLRGLARDPRERHPSAQVFRDELRKWLRPVTTPLAGDEARSGTVDFLLRRMRHKSDFPAMSGSIVRIQSISSSDRESVASLTNEILKDVALTNKLLRLVNTPQYTRGGPISTVSRAVTLVGFNGIRTMALSLVLLEHMQDKAHANLLKEEFLRSLMAGAIAAELSPPRSEEGEEAFLGAMFQNLGRLLTEYYFPEEARAVRALMGGKEPLPEISATITVLGISYEQLGVGISKAWNLPDSIRHCMRKPEGPPPATPPKEAGERLRWIALASNEMADALLHHEADLALTKVVQTGQRYARSLGLDSKGVEAATQRARDKLAELARAIDFKVAPESPAARLLQSTPLSGGPRAVTLHEVVPDDGFHDSVGSFELHATQPVTPEQVAALARQSQHVAEMLAAGIQDITNAMVEDFKLADILRMILETMFRAMQFRQIVFCMRDPKLDALTGRFGLGAGVERIVKTFRIPLHPANTDLFSAVCAKGSDTMIADASEERVAGRLPDWYRHSVHAPTFLLLPLMLKGSPFGLIYADKGEPGELQLGEKELALLRTLRNQAVMAFRQSS
ncbi:MAG: HDOD domain-containing protein [Hylemonella sp.]|uniref:serine/threonine protein kinase n=1 Tax=Hylemonella sp. TaxID=2066020 RepID=UPI0022C8825B|nr:serine/threonine protein kinase [Hylemonella sp.]MCZ8253444.1 HDOD domain-containing protein [Hylemonella sp.]